MNFFCELTRMPERPEASIIALAHVCSPTRASPLSPRPPCDSNWGMPQPMKCVNVTTATVHTDPNPVRHQMTLAPPTALHAPPPTPPCSRPPPRPRPRLTAHAHTQCRPAAPIHLPQEAHSPAQSTLHAPSPPPYHRIPRPSLCRRLHWPRSRTRVSSTNCDAWRYRGTKPRWRCRSSM